MRQGGDGRARGTGERGNGGLHCMRPCSSRWTSVSPRSMCQSSVLYRPNVNYSNSLDPHVCLIERQTQRSRSRHRVRAPDGIRYAAHSLLLARARSKTKKDGESSLRGAGKRAMRGAPVRAWRPRRTRLRSRTQGDIAARSAAMPRRAGSAGSESSAPLV